MDIRGGWRKRMSGVAVKESSWDQVREVRRREHMERDLELVRKHLWDELETLDNGGSLESMKVILAGASRSGGFGAQNGHLLWPEKISNAVTATPI